MILASTVARVASRYGAAYTLRRAVQAAGAQPWQAGAETVTYTALVARERGYRPQEIKGSIQEGDVLLVADAGSLGTKPRVGDRVALGTFAADAGAEWRQIVSVYEAREAGQTRVYRIQARR